MRINASNAPTVRFDADAEMEGSLCEATGIDGLVPGCAETAVALGRGMHN